MLDFHQTADGIQEQQRGEQAGKNLGTTKRAFSLFVLPKSPRICHLISDFDGFSGGRFVVVAIMVALFLWDFNCDDAVGTYNKALLPAGERVGDGT